MRHEFFDHHRDGDSIIHRFDPRLKIMMLLSFILPVSVLTFQHLGVLLLYTLAPFLLSMLSRVSIFHFFSKVLKLMPMILVVTIFLPFIPTGSVPSYEFGWVRIDSQGLEQFILINLKAFLILFMSVVLTTTTDLMMILRALEKFRTPEIVIITVSFMYRFIFLLIDEMERMIMGFRSRYVCMTLTRRFGIATKMMGAFFIRTYERGERIYLAMESRGFRGKVFTLENLHWKIGDSIALGIYLLGLLLPLWIWIYEKRCFF